MRALVVVSLVAFALLPAVAHAQTPPVVIIGPPPATSGLPPQATPSVPPGYEVEGDLGGMHFRGRVYMPSAPQTAPAPAPQPAPPVVAPPPAMVTAPPSGPMMFVQPTPQPSYPTVYQPAYPTYAPYAPPMRARGRAPRLDDGMDFGGRFLLDIVGAGIGAGAAIGLSYLINQGARDDSFSVTALVASAGLVPAGISIFGGAIAGGRGRYWGALFGELIGGGLAATVIAAGGIQFHDPWELVAAIGGPAILGAIIGFEAQHGLRTERLQHRMEQEGLAIDGLSVAPLAQGNGAMVGMTGSF